ncbi:MAG: hypothetical protein GY795_02235 [Desulfobacterales bacterium]|nr:hypothetical protein [Desulfobacterales bacterium]
MNIELKKSLDKSLKKAEADGVSGNKASKTEFNDINLKLGGIIPDWYIELLTTYPLCGLVFEWQEYPEEDDFDSRSSVFWSRPSDIWDETHGAYPGAGIFEKGYFNIMCDDDGMGDPYFMSSNDGDNPTVLHVYHEGVIGADTKIGEFDAGIAAKKLSEFIDKAIL